MDRTNGANFTDIGSGRRGFRDRNLGLGQAGTIVDAQFLNGLQEELVRPIELLGLTPDAGNREQLMQALRRLAGGSTRTVTANTTLTPDDAGVVQVSAAGGNVTLTLPAAAGAGGHPISLAFVRTDSSANSVTIQRAGTDLIEGIATVTLPRAGRLTLISDGAGAWFTRSEAAVGRSYGTSGWQRLPGGLMVQWGTGTTNASGIATITLPAAFLTDIWSVSVTEGLGDVWGSTNFGVYGTYGRTVAGFSVISVTFNGSWAPRSATFLWTALGR